MEKVQIECKRTWKGWNGKASGMKALKRNTNNEKYKGDALLQKTYLEISLLRRGYRKMVKFLNTM
jgi:hypothetical protein